MEKIESYLDKVFGKSGPLQLPENARKSLVEWLPWINLVFGLLQLWAAWALWRLAYWANTIVDYTNSLYQVAGVSPADTLDTFFWISIAILLLDAALLLIAFPGLKERSKSKGWNILFYAVLVNFAYGITRLFSTLGGGVSALFWTLVSTAIGLFFLFQVRHYYDAKKSKK